MMRYLLIISSALALTACGGDPETTAPPPAATTGDAAERAASEETASSAPENSADTSTVLAALGPDYLEADLANGARQYRRCQACHMLTEGGRHTVGPNLHGIVGQPAAAQEGFSYSRQLQEAGLVWDAATLDAWIENPRALVPGNRMSFVGLRDPAARRDTIAYIAAESAEQAE